MRKLIAKVFFTDDCARGAMFSLTLLTIGNLLWALFLHMAMLAQGRWSWELRELFYRGAAVISLYALVIAGCALVELAVRLWDRRTLRPLWWLLPAGACLAAGGFGFLRAFPPTILFCCMCDSAFNNHFDLPLFFGDGVYGAPFFLLALVLLQAGVVMLAAVFAAAEGKKIRALFGKATLTLWGLLALWYFITLGMALYESHRAADVRRAIERRFGRPLTSAGLEAMYRESGVIDEDFWKRSDELHAALPKIEVPVKEDDEGELHCLFPGVDESQIVMISEEASWRFDDIRLPDRPSAEMLAWYGRLCREHRAAIEAWEACFDRVPPLPPMECGYFRYSEIDACRSFVQMERSRLILALALGDAEAALGCYRRIGNLAVLSPIWRLVESRRLDFMEKMLESRLFTDARLDEWETDLAELERAVPRNHLRAMYIEAARIQNLFMELEEGRFDEDAAAFDPYRWVLPPFWYHAVWEKKAVLENFLRPDFSFFTPRSHLEVEVPYILSARLLGQDHIGNRFYALTARTRGMQVLLRAERYRREHGEFPQTLDVLPEDPFTGKAMIYKIGPAEIEETVWKMDYNGINTWDTAVKATVEAVQVYSDPVRTLEKKQRYPKEGGDMTRAVIRLWSKAAGEVQTR